MADLSADLTNDDSGFEQVIIQRDKILVDAEFNEIGRISRVRDYRLFRMATNNSGEKATQHGRVMACNIEIVAGPGDGQVTIQPLTGLIGVIAYRGYVLRLTTPVELSGITLDPIVDEEYQIYVKFTEAEIGAIDDSAIKINLLDETSRRQKVVVEFLLGAANVDTASVGHTAAEPYESITATKAGLLAVVRRDGGINEPVQDYQIFNWYIPTPEFDLFRITNKFFTRDSPTSPAYASWDLAFTQLTLSNIALVIVGAWAGALSLPMKINLPLVTSLPNDGDAIIVHVPPSRQLTSDISPIGMQAIENPTMSELTVTVENIGKYSKGHVDLSGEDGFAGRVIVAVRVNEDEIVLCNGKTVRYSSSILGLPGEGTVKITEDNVMLEHREKGDTASYANDMLAYVHSRYTSQSVYSLLSSWREKDVNGDQVFVRLYICKDDESQGMAITHNARWQAQALPLWFADDKDNPSSIIRFGNYKLLSVNEARITFAQKADTDASWKDDEWDLLGDNNILSFAHLMLNPEGRFVMPNTSASAIEGIRRVEFTGSGDPTKTEEYTNTNAIGAVKVCKAWGYVTCTNGVVVLVEGVGISSVTQVNTEIRITLLAAFTNTNYIVELSTRQTPIFQVGYAPVSASVFDILGCTKAGVDIDFSAAGTYRVAFACYGRR